MEAALHNMQCAHLFAKSWATSVSCIAVVVAGVLNFFSCHSQERGIENITFGIRDTVNTDAVEIGFETTCTWTAQRRALLVRIGCAD